MQTINFTKNDLHILIPVVRLRYNATWPNSNVPLDCITVKAYEFLSEDGKRTNSFLEKILVSGGVNSYIKFKGSVILSSIMSDRKVFGLTADKYISLVEKLKPDYYFTPDAETYLNETALSAFELNRIMKDTEYIKTRCKRSKAIGLVKGCNLKQVQEHSRFLQNLGISTQVFHAGDFLRRSTKKEGEIALGFAKEIRHIAKSLFIYGIGSPRTMRRFSFADGFIMQSHFINPYRGRKPTKKNSIISTQERVWYNFERTKDALDALDSKTQPKLAAYS